jgi:hypothetical protein
MLFMPRESILKLLSLATMATIEKKVAGAEGTRQFNKVQNGAVLNTKAAPLAFKNLIATEVVEDDLVCGIEIAPCSSDGVSTITTAQISTDQSESWSLEREGSQDSNHGFASTRAVLRYKPSLFLPKDVNPYGNLLNYDSLNANSPSSSLSDDDQESDDSSNSYSFHRRIDSLLKSLEDSPPAAAKPMFMLRFECTQYEPQQDGEDPTADDPAALTCITEVSSDQWVEQVAPLNISPDLSLQSMISVTHKRLCQLELCSTDVPFLRNAADMTNAIVPAPFMMFPEKSTVIVSRDRPGGNYTVSSRGPMAGGVLTHLFDVQGNINGRIVKIKSYAFRDTIPPFVAHHPIPLNASTVRVRLDNWRRSNNNKKKSERNSNSNRNFIVATTAKHQHHHQHGRPRRTLLVATHDQQLSPSSATSSSRGGTRVYCTTQMLAAVAAATSQRPSEAASDTSDGAISLFRDDELRAMMEITQDGENTSALFPSCSTESEIDFCSDDGLGDEISALDEINRELRKELAIADILSADILPISKFHNKESIILPHTPLSWDMRYEDDEGTDTTETDEDDATMTTDERELESMLESISLSDDDHDDDMQPLSILPDLPARITNLKGSRYFPSDRHGRRVRFAEYIDEFVFLSDHPTTGAGGGAQTSAETPQPAETPEWVNTLEDVYYLFEDFMEDLGYSCTQAMEQNRPRPSPDKKTRASTAYYI